MPSTSNARLSVDATVRLRGILGSPRPSERANDGRTGPDHAVVCSRHGEAVHRRHQENGRRQGAALLKVIVPTSEPHTNGGYLLESQGLNHARREPNLAVELLTELDDEPFSVRSHRSITAVSGWKIRDPVPPGEVPEGLWGGHGDLRWRALPSVR